ncbi:MAG: DUF5655 domain-containing protein [Candidatus Dormibacteraceae bacterium]
MTEAQSWAGIRARSAGLLRRRTWRHRLRAGVARLGRFGYPDFLTASATQLIDQQYADRPQLRPGLDAILRQAAALASDVTVQARKGFVTLVARRTFAVIRATTRQRVDLGLRLADVRPDDDRLLPPGSGLGASTVRLALRTEGDVDERVTALLAQALSENL